MELPVRRLAGIVLGALIVLATSSQAPNAQTSDKSGSGGVADQFQAGAQRIGEGATRIGEGIKQGAIQTWEAVKAGASAAADKLHGGKSAPKSAVAPSRSPSSDAPPAD